MDTGNFYWYGNPIDKVYEILKSVAKYTKHTHVKNIQYPEETRNQQREIGWEYGKYVSPIYEGDIDHDRVIRMLNFSLSSHLPSSVKNLEKKVEKWYSLQNA